ncbi:hypothetical protein TPHA_0A02800 [Tetrapisispora phaffii CBS 4417]|uniref:GPI ethanolamine phosphate transferase 1 n=1 Tax=Tetrapisispora phaffii (strain ATCC 24235 / CBS 4417 / NBRC 1672 / NRRL Y-8282 / UCD 70-5) TaxID=1071381 RepID=G8BN83_TETPH|nr:hypothetical protein TPHA_0A02800 [Tetrapisispora phaffii CBS 4417]CCE61361.1 hypothetical protein TPHA_0A02800 [Tetrapisispora phaffii CBS 4417]
MLRNPRTTLIIVGIFFHLFYLWSIFDIYFVSPLVHGMSYYRSTDAPPAKRLFLIVGDGLRADTTFDLITHPVSGETAYLAPYIRSIVLNNGTYGISHTRMPTESRPGHVAMIAGFYEDVSAVTKGWKENPVNFDSFFNQTNHTYSFGSPDILPMFKQGASDPNKIDAWMYGHEFEDFSQSSLELDAFVFDHVNELFKNATLDSDLNEQIKQDGNCFFLHLLGCDTAGHSYRPYSAEYYDNVKYIDMQISQLVEKVNDFFGDDQTAFVFTADHGMSAFGSHGDGHPNNTRTPLVAWGAGINKPEKHQYPIVNNYTESWGFDYIKRNDVKQADIASLMSYLIGTNYPANSVGELPISFIDGEEGKKMHSLLNNAKSILEQYIVKEAEIIDSQFIYKEYYKFQEKSYHMYLQEINQLISNIEAGEINLEKDAIELIEELITITLEGLQYLTTYNWIFIRSIVTMGFIGWIVYAFSLFLRLFILNKSNGIYSTSIINLLFFTTTGIILYYILYYQRSPFNYYMYLLFPLFFWSQIVTMKMVLKTGIKEFFNGISTSYKILISMAIILIYEGIVYGFLHRWIFSVIFNILAFYPLACGVNGIYTNLGWIITSACISTFTTFDAVKIEDLNQINTAAVLIIISGIYGLHKVKKLLSSYSTNLFIFQIVLVALSCLISNKSATSLQLREGLPRDAQIGGWISLFVTLIVCPFMHYRHPVNDYRVRLLLIYLMFAPTFIILSISFEALFYFFFTCYIIQWIEIESYIKVTYKQNNWLQLLRVSVIGFFLLQVAFFGTGNVSSISSFSLDSVYRLTPIFDPFLMGALLMLKLLIPYLLLSIGLGILNQKLQIKDYAISTLIISSSDMLSLNLFYLVKTDGSWLDIGMTISNYCLAILSSLFMLVLEIVSHILLKNVTIERPVTEGKKKN